MDSIYKDLTGDPAYDFLKTKTLDGYSIDGGQIIERKSVGPKEPRFILEVLVKGPEGVSRTYTYNYKKLLREITK